MDPPVSQSITERTCKYDYENKYFVCKQKKQVVIVLVVVVVEWTKLCTK